MYYPLSQLTTNLSTSNGEFILLDNGETYVGNYYATSDGNYFTGNTPQDGPNLMLVQDVANNSQKDVEAGLEGSFTTTDLDLNLNSTINLLPPTYQSSIPFPVSSAPAPIASITFPTEEEYNTGEFVRYFLKKSNSSLYIEVNNKTYINYSNENPNTQYQLYTPIKINWDLTGNPIDTYIVNKNIVLLNEKSQNLLGFEFSFRGKFVKYYKPTTQNFFNTSGGELKVEIDSENYSGYYHVNSNRGVIMEGKFHKPTFHRVLVPFKSDEIKQDIKVKINNEVGTSIRKNIQRKSGY
jgi:hypothetical protein